MTQGAKTAREKAEDRRATLRELVGRKSGYRGGRYRVKRGPVVIPIDVFEMALADAMRLTYRPIDSYPIPYAEAA